MEVDADDRPPLPPGPAGEEPPAAGRAPEPAGVSSKQDEAAAANGAVAAPKGRPAAADDERGRERGAKEERREERRSERDRCAAGSPPGVGAQGGGASCLRMVRWLPDHWHACPTAAVLCCWRGAGPASVSGSGSAAATRTRTEGPSAATATGQHGTMTGPTSGVSSAAEAAAGRSATASGGGAARAAAAAGSVASGEAGGDPGPACGQASGRPPQIAVNLRASNTSAPVSRSVSAGAPPPARAKHSGTSGSVPATTALIDCWGLHLRATQAVYVSGCHHHTAFALARCSDASQGY